MKSKSEKEKARLIAQIDKDIARLNGLVEALKITRLKIVNDAEILPPGYITCRDLYMLPGIGPTTLKYIVHELRAHKIEVIGNPDDCR